MTEPECPENVVPAATDAVEAAAEVGSELGVDRRTFLRMGAGAAATLAVTACADDGVAGDGEDTGTDTGGDDEVGSTDETGTETGSSDDTTGSTETETTETTEESTETEGEETDTTGGEDPCLEGEIIDFDPEALDYDEELFPLAVMAGEMRPESVMLAVYIDDAQPKTLRVWLPTDTPGQVELVKEMEVAPNADGYLKVSVDGLCPGTWYRYGYFTSDGQSFLGRSLLGEVRTAIAEDSLEPVVVAMSACNGSSFDWPALDRTAEEYYDVFCHLGDMAYNDGAFSTEEYRDRWKQYLSAQGFKDVYGLAGLYATWDDHEITDNSDFDRETNDPNELEKKSNALNAYFEVLPIEGGEGNFQLWRSFRWGLTAEFIVLDCRYERLPSQGEYMTQAQMDWLKQTLLDSPCHFKVILNSVPITNMPFIWDIAASDRWEGFPDSRSELLNFIDDEQIENIWFISGDFHVCFVSRIESMGANLAARTREIAVTGGNTNILGSSLTLSGHFDYGVGQPRGCVLTFDPSTDSVNCRFINPDGGDDYNEDLTQD